MSDTENEEQYDKDVQHEESDPTEEGSVPEVPIDPPVTSDEPEGKTNQPEAPAEEE